MPTLPIPSRLVPASLGWRPTTLGKPLATTLATVLTLALGGALVTAPLTAQSLDGWGVTAGLNRGTLGGGFSDLIEDVGGTVDPRYGFSLGGYALFGIADRTWFRPELTLTQKGFRVPAENGVRRRELDLTYLDLAALVRRTFPFGPQEGPDAGAAGEAFEGWVGAGPVLSLNLSANGRVGDAEGDFGDEIKSSDFSLAFEAGVNRGRLGVGLRYVLGLTNISTSSDPDESSKTRGLMLLASYAVR